MQVGTIWKHWHSAKRFPAKSKFVTFVSMSNPEEVMDANTLPTDFTHFLLSIKILLQVKEAVRYLLELLFNLFEDQLCLKSINSCTERHSCNTAVAETKIPLI